MKKEIELVLTESNFYFTWKNDKNEVWPVRVDFSSGSNRFCWKVIVYVKQMAIASFEQYAPVSESNASFWAETAIKNELDYPERGKLLGVLY